MRIRLLLLFLLGTMLLYAQPRKAIKEFENAKTSFAQGNKEEGEAFLKSALLIDPNYTQARMMLADHLYQMERYSKAIPHYENLVIEIENDQVALYRLANCLYWNSDFELAIETFDLYLDHPKASQQMLPKVDGLVKSCVFALEQGKQMYDLQMQNMGDSVNTKWMEYFPAITADAQTFYFTRNQGKGGRYQEDFYCSKWLNGRWSKAIEVEGSLNTDDNEGAMGISSDGRVLFFTACQRPEGQGGCDLFISIKKDGQWSKAFPLPDNVNTQHRDSQPSISFDGRTLYFSSNRPGGFGGKDIWMTQFVGVGVWTDPINLGERINTKGDESTPFIHWDNAHLYFASTGHLGIGGSDLFVADRKGEGWSEPVHLGRPLNTQGEESGLIVSPDGKTGFFSTDGGEEGKGMIDLYQFVLPDFAQSDQVAYLTGRIFDKESGESIQASLDIIDLETGLVRQEFLSEVDGSYYICLPLGKAFSMQVMVDGYLFYSEYFELEEGRPLGKTILDIPLSRIKSGETLELHNVFFEVNESTLKPSSYKELDLVVSILENNAQIEFEIGGHTDNTGSLERNRELSLARAQSVADYLVLKGIDQTRMNVKGYGSTVPIQSNDTEEGRRANRRTEIKFN